MPLLISFILQISNKTIFTEVLNEFLLLNFRYFTYAANPFITKLNSLTSQVDPSINGVKNLQTFLWECLVRKSLIYW